MQDFIDITDLISQEQQNKINNLFKVEIVGVLLTKPTTFDFTYSPICKIYFRDLNRKYFKNRLRNVGFNTHSVLDDEYISNNGLIGFFNMFYLAFEDYMGYNHPDVFIEREYEKETKKLIALLEGKYEYKSTDNWRNG